MQKVNNEKAYVCFDSCFDPWLVCFVSLLYPDGINYYCLESKDNRLKYQNRHYGELKPDKECKYYSIYKNLMIITNVLDSHWRFEAIL